MRASMFCQREQTRSMHCVAFRRCGRPDAWRRQAGDEWHQETAAMHSEVTAACLHIRGASL